MAPTIAREFEEWRRTLRYTAVNQGGIVAPVAPTQNILAQSEVATFDGGADVLFSRGISGGTTYPEGFDESKRIVILGWNLQARNIAADPVRLKLVSIEDPTGTPVERVIHQWLIPPNTVAGDPVSFQDLLICEGGIPLPLREGESAAHFARPAKLSLHLRNDDDSGDVNLSTAFAVASNGHLSLLIWGFWAPARSSVGFGRLSFA